jgi:alanine dehydrogenase
VPRTAAMALSNTLLPLMRRIADCESATDSVRLIPEVRNAVITFMGKAVNRRIAKLAGLRHMDINLLLNCC